MDLTGRPFYLDKDQLAWVENTLATRSEDEKIGQLFINLTIRRNPETIDRLVNRYHIGGVRWQGGTKEEVWLQNRLFQEKSRIPVLIAANCEAGGNGALSEGTLVATGAACAAAPDEETIRDMAYVGAEEAGTVGCNVSFAPVCDVVSNWRNTIVNTRAYGNDPEQIIKLSRTYMAEMKKHGIACAAKHFPGDGSEERDQHLIMGCNDLSAEDWEASYGKVYRALIEDDLECVMAGHICQPAMSRKYRPHLKDEEIMPATLAPELLQDLLRGELGFNGVIITDATHMAGLEAKARRRDFIPGVIAAGVDMILFFNDPDEDIQYIRQALRDGRLKPERLDEAVTRILALKASLRLYERPFPEESALSKVGCEAHRMMAEKAADASITLVKDTQNLLPVDPEKMKRVFLIYLQQAPAGSSAGLDAGKQRLIRALTDAGFSVDAPDDFYERDRKHPGPFNRFQMMESISREEFRQKYDLVIFAVNMDGYAQTNNVRLSYSSGHSFEIPWFVPEVPTLAVSLNYTNHLYDVPMMKTFINAYSSTEPYIRKLVDKITGKSPFKGTANELVWCGRWDTRL